MVTCASPEQLHAALEELSLPTLEAESREGQPVTHGFPRSASRRWEWVEPWTHVSTKFVKSARQQWLPGPPL